MITQEGFGEKDNQNDGINDGMWCQTSRFGRNNGRWIRPDGQRISSAIDSNDTLYAVSRCGQVGLLRRASIDKDPFQGLYQCIIPDKAGTEQTLVVWIGGSDFSTYAENRGMLQSCTNRKCDVDYHLQHCKNRIVKLTKLFRSGNESHTTKYHFVILTKPFVLN